MDLSCIKGIGEKSILDLEKLGINTTFDLITYYPKKYFILKRSIVEFINDGDRIIMDGRVASVPVISKINNKLSKITFRLMSDNNFFNVVVFNQNYLCKTLHIGSFVTVIGKYDKYRNNIILNEIRNGLIGKVKVEPIYSVSGGVSRNFISKMINNALNENIKVIDEIPSDLIEKYKFPDKMWSIREIHNPSSTINYKKALQRLKYEELYSYFLKIKKMREINNDSLNCIKRVIDDSKLNEFISSFSYELTASQKETVNEIKKDMISAKRMNRLVQGDVGSGKTIVAFIASYINFLSGYQTAMMVPTEILANQHYSNAISLFDKFGVRICLLTSNVKNKSKVYNDILRGEYDFVIGTQSLIQDKLKFKNLGLVITDEQHRFGVNQRNNLKNKGEYPDILSMSATPIPRTYALTIYGDMDVSSIKTKPSCRKDVITYVKNESQILDILYMMRKELVLGHQIYIVAPAILGSDDLDNVNTIYEKMNLAFGKKYNIKEIHGKLDVDKKNKIMTDFEKGKIDILVSTTVIEVGVNVPNASMIVIFNANSYGLSTIHQLRGRVGRGDIQSYCVLVDKELSDRLSFLKDCSDGFLISEYDFKNRGEGDLFGVRQSGEANFKLASIVNDFEMLLRVKEDIK